ncbi:MAG: hypothetical protein U9R39_04855 [Campylobacterota bacterium]|nr:hypothetical protein [Campylobacterota bacterium]
MDKKLKKYIESYDKIQNCETYSLIPNGGMIVLINQETNCEVFIDNNTYLLKSFQAILINAYEESIDIKSNENINLIVVRFKGAGASFFYEKHMEELMHIPNEPIFLEENIKENELDSYFKNHFKPSKLPFNIMKIIDLLDEQKSDYNIDEVLVIANVPRKILDKQFRLMAGLTFKTYATLKEI